MKSEKRTRPAGRNAGMVARENIHDYSNDRSELVGARDTFALHSVGSRMWCRVQWACSTADNFSKASVFGAATQIRHTYIGRIIIVQRTLDSERCLFRRRDVGARHAFVKARVFVDGFGAERTCSGRGVPNVGVRWSCEIRISLCAACCARLLLPSRASHTVTCNVFRLIARRREPRRGAPPLARTESTARRRRWSSPPLVAVRATFF